MNQLKERLSDYQRIGLVLGGGGAKGAYQVGVFKALRDLGVDRFECMAGTSVGTLNALLFSTASVEEAEVVWRGLARILKPARNVLYSMLFYTLTYSALFLPLFLSGLLAALYVSGIVTNFVSPPGLLRHEQMRFLLQALLLSALGIATIGLFSRTWEFWGAAPIYTFDLRRFHAVGYPFIGLFVYLYVLTVEDSPYLSYVWGTAAFGIWALWAMLVLTLSRIARRYSFFGNDEIATLVRARLAYPQEQWRSTCVLATVSRETSFFHPTLIEDGDSKFYKRRNGLQAEVGHFTTRWVPVYLDLHKAKQDVQLDVMLASAAIPIGFPAIKDTTDSNPNESNRIPIAATTRWLCDGGVVDNLPLAAVANLASCDLIIVVALNKGEVPTLDTMQHHIDRMWSDSVVPFLTIDERKTLLAKFNETGEWRQHVPGRQTIDCSRVLVVAPSKALCVVDLPILRFFTGTLNFDARMIDKWITQGYVDALEQL